MASITLNKNSVPGETHATSCIPFTLPHFFVLCHPLTHFFFRLSSVLNLLMSITSGDKSALVPGGIRIGSPAMTTRGLGEKEFVLIADFIHEGVQITLEAKRLAPGTKLQDFMKFLSSPEFPLRDQVANLRKKVEALTTRYPLPGV